MNSDKQCPIMLRG